MDSWLDGTFSSVWLGGDNDSHEFELTRIKFYEAVLIPFEISALNLVLTFWRDDIPVAAVVAACIVLYA